MHSFSKGNYFDITNRCGNISPNINDLLCDTYNTNFLFTIKTICVATSLLI